LALSQQEVVDANTVILYAYAVSGKRLAGLGGKFPFHIKVRRRRQLEDHQNASDVEEGARGGMKSDTNSTNPYKMTQEPIPSLLQFLTIRLPRRRGTWLAGVLILLSFSNAFAESDFSTFWKKFKSAVIAGDKAAVAEMTKFPLSMGYEMKVVKNKENFLRRYNEIFKGDANAAQCFGRAEPHKQSAGQYDVYCPFKETPDDKEDTPIRFIFELTKSGWRFVGLDNINE